jgi:L-arabinose isomerase
MNITRRKKRTANIGIFGVGFHKYWPQFDGLLDELTHKLNIFTDRVKAHEVQVTSFGIADDAESAYAMLPKLKAANLDLVFCHMLTYATSASFGAIIRGLDVPIILVALQPLKALDYSKASTYIQLCNDDFCAVPEFTGVAIRMGKKPPPVIIGTLEDDPAANREITEWCNIAMVLHDLKRARIGHFGHPIENMLDMQTDHTALTAAFGCHIVQTEPDDLLELRGIVHQWGCSSFRDGFRDGFVSP